jgi:hypothetical protein
MAKQIIVLTQSSDGTNVTYQFAFWFPITAGITQQPTVTSQWAGASTGDNTAIQNGTIKEEIYLHTFPIGTSTATIKAVVNQAWTLRNTQLAGIGPNQFFGVFFDSVNGWSA